MGNYRPFLQGPLPVANYTRIIIPGRFWTRPPSTKSTRMASSATPLHDSLIELAIPDAHAHAIKWYLLKNDRNGCGFTSKWAGLPKFRARPHHWNPPYKPWIRHCTSFLLFLYTLLNFAINCICLHPLESKVLNSDMSM